MPACISIRDIQLINLCRNEIEAIYELHRRYIEGPMTPSLLYDLIYSATGDESKALHAQMKLELAQMPEPTYVK